MKNRRAEISITILVIGVFVVCTLALISFFMSSIAVKNSFVGVGLMEKINLQIEAYSYDSNTNIDTKINNEGKRVFYQDKYGKVGFIFGSEKILFSVEYPVAS